MDGHLKILPQFGLNPKCRRIRGILPRLLRSGDWEEIDEIVSHLIDCPVCLKELTDAQLDIIGDFLITIFRGH